MESSSAVRRILTTFAVAGAIMVPLTASAQGYGQGRGGYGSGQGHGNNGYARGDWRVRELVDSAERESNDFRHSLESREYLRDVRDRQTDRFGRDKSGNRDSRIERWRDDMIPSVQRLDQAFERLRKATDNNRPGQGRREMEEVVVRAREVERHLGNGRGAYSNRNYGYGAGGRNDLLSDWNRLRNDISELARMYGVSSLNGRWR